MKKAASRFDRWRTRLPANTAYLVELVLAEIVPLFEAQGFQRYPDYAGGSAQAVGAGIIALQRREGACWPTVELTFERSRRPAVQLVFAALPEVCHRLYPVDADIPRLQASVVEGDAFFNLCRGDGKFVANMFGYTWLALRPKHRLRADVALLKSLLPQLFALFERGIPADWHGRRTPITPHIHANTGARYLHRCTPTTGTS